MSRNQILGAVAFAASAVVIASAARVEAQDSSHGAPASVAQPSGESAEVLAQSRGYEKWQRLAEYEQGPVESKGHGGMYVVAWANEAAMSAKAGEDLPAGSVIVKENRPSAEAKPAAVTIMAKRGGSWYWVKATPDLQKVMTEGGKPVAGQVASCTNCHAMAKRDQIFSRMR